MAELSRGQILKYPEIISGVAGAGATIRLQDADKSAYIDIKTPDAVGAAYTLTLPADDGTNGDVLIFTNGTGGLSFGPVPANGSDTQITYNNAGSSAGAAVTTDSNNLYFDAGNGVIFKDNVDLYSKIQHSATADIGAIGGGTNPLIYNLPTEVGLGASVLKIKSISNGVAELHWATDETSAGATAAIGGDRAIQFSDAGFLGGSQDFTFQSDNTLEVVGNLFLGDPTIPDDITSGIATFLTRVSIGTDTDDSGGQEIPLIVSQRVTAGTAIKILPDQLISTSALDIEYDYNDISFGIRASGTGIPLRIESGSDILLSPSVTGGDVYLENARSFRFYNSSNTNYGGIEFSNPTVDYTISFPGTNGNEDDILQKNASGGMQWVDNRRVANAVFYGGTNPIGLGSTIILSIPNDCTIIESRLIAGQSDTMTVIVERSSFATTPTWSDISNGGQALSAAVAVSNTTLTGWTLTLNRGDLLRFRVTSAPTSAVNATLSLMLRAR